MKYTVKQLIERLDTEIEMVCCDSARSDWQTLKTAVLAQQTNNTGSPKLPPSCTECVLVKICHVSPGYGMPLCKETWRQLRAGA